jgi:hypothetical protein
MPSNLEARLDILRGSKSFPPVLIDRLGNWVATAPEEQLYRINPLKWAKKNAVDENLTIDLFLYATNAGIFDMVWSVLCTQCGLLITSPGGLKAMSRGKRQCRL